MIGTLAAAAGAGGGTAVHAHKTSKAASRHERGGAIFALRARAMQVKVRLGVPTAERTPPWPRARGKNIWQWQEPRRGSTEQTDSLLSLEEEEVGGIICFSFSGSFAFAFF